MKAFIMFMVKLCLIALNFKFSSQYVQDHDLTDMYKREHSIVRPYGGMFTF